MKAESAISQFEWDTCLSVLQRVKQDVTIAHDLTTLQTELYQIHDQIRKKEKKRQKEAREKQDRELLESCLRAQIEPMDDLDIQQKHPFPIPRVDFTKTEQRKLNRPVRCYVCKDFFHDVHFFYPRLCPLCANQNYQKRSGSVDLKGYTALITGGRIKIGYETALRLLRDGATVLVTTRFPKSAIQRYQKESDFEMWKHRLKIYFLDLKHIPSVEQFAHHLLTTLPSLEILINNAAQTIRRPQAFYEHLKKFEQLPVTENEKPLLGYSEIEQQKIPFLEGQEENALLNLEHFPKEKYDVDAQQVDLRPKNTWSTKLADVETRELLEVQVVNSISPFLLNSRLKPLFLKSSFRKRFIVNVSAMEGQFNRKTKTDCHPHTNMAKAALNMMTRTSAQDYAKDQIYMNSVDTGWVTQEHAYPIKKALREKGFVPPLDCIDGASRVYDPIVTGISEKKKTPVFGKFLKDYKISEW